MHTLNTRQNLLANQHIRVLMLRCLLIAYISIVSVGCIPHADAPMRYSSQRIIGQWVSAEDGSMFTFTADGQWTFVQADATSVYGRYRPLDAPTNRKQISYMLKESDWIVYLMLGRETTADTVFLQIDGTTLSTSWERR